MGVGIAEDRCVVRERSSGADIRCGVDDGAQGFEPAGGDDGIAVEQDDVMHRAKRGSGGKPGIGGGREAAVHRVAQHLPARQAGKPVEQSCHGGIGRGVIDDDDACVSGDRLAQRR